MKVERVTTRLVRREIGGGVWNARSRWATKSMVLAFVETDGGEVGVGEGWTTAGSPEALVRVIEDEVAPLVVGEDPFFVSRVWHRAFAATETSSRAGIVAAALGAVDTALWDLVGRLTGTPLYKLLGAHDDRVFTYASAGLYGAGKTPDDLGAGLAGYVAQGFTTVKMKVAGVPLADDVARVRAAREAIGPDARLMVDANYGLTVPEALAMARAFEPFDVAFFEAPVSPYDVAGQARVAAQSPIPLCGNETLSWRRGFLELLRADAVELVQFDLAACGGVSEGRRIADLAAAFHRPCTLHAASSAVLFAASLHLAAACANGHSVEYHMLHQWLWDLGPEGAFAIEPGGYVRPPAGPGIGLGLTPDEIRE